MSLFSILCLAAKSWWYEARALAAAGWSVLIENLLPDWRSIRGSGHGHREGIRGNRGRGSDSDEVRVALRRYERVSVRFL